MPNKPHALFVAACRIDPTHVVVICPHCHREHYHGASEPGSESHRAAPCRESGGIGYNIHDVAPSGRSS